MNEMAIQMRRGFHADFDPSKMLAGEWAVAMDQDTLKQVVWMCFSPGVVKRMGTYEDFKQQILDATGEIKEEYLTQFNLLLEHTEEARNQSINAAQNSENSAALAATSATQANTAKTTAKSEADKSAAFAAQALEYKNACSESSIEAKSYSCGGTNSREGEETDNAKYYNEQAKKVLKSLEQAGTVTGIKGNKENAYRTGNVNLTPENIGALKGKVINSSVDFNTLTENGIYIINATGNINCPQDGSCILFVEASNTKIEQTFFQNYGIVDSYLYSRYYGEGNYGNIEWWSWHEVYIENARKAYADAEGNVIKDSYAVRKTITEGDFNDMTTPGLYTMRQTSGNRPNSDASYYGLLVLKSDNRNYIEQLAFRENSYEVYIRTCGSSGWTLWKKINDGGTATKATQDGNGNVITNTYLQKTGDTANNTITFSSPDALDPASWVNVQVITSGEKHGIIFNKIVNMCKNVRYLYKRLGTTSISSLGDGTVTGAINEVNNNLSTWQNLTMSEVYSGFRYDHGVMKYHPILKLAFISVTIQATTATTTGVKIDMCKFNKIPSVNTAIAARTPNTAGQAINAALFTTGILSLSTNKAIPMNGYILCSGIYSFT